MGISLHVAVGRTEDRPFSSSGGWVKEGIWKKKQSQLKPVLSPFPQESADHTAVPSSIHPVSRFEKPLSALYWGAGMGTEGHRDFWSLI